MARRRKAKKNFFFGGKKAKAPAVETWSVSYEVWKDRMPRRGSKKFTAEELAGWYHTTLADPTVDGVRIKSASGPGGLKRVAEILGVSQTALNNSSWTRAYNNPDRYQIPSDWPEDLWEWGPQPRLAQWTGYPEYSYEQFYRKNPSDAAARAVRWEVADNAGWPSGFQPDIFPYGQGGRPYEYKFGKAKKNPDRDPRLGSLRKKLKELKAHYDGAYQYAAPDFVLSSLREEIWKVEKAIDEEMARSTRKNPKRKRKKRGEGAAEIITCHGVYGPHMIRRGDLFGQVEGDLVCLRCYHESLPDLPQYGKAKKNPPWPREVTAMGEVWELDRIYGPEIDRLYGGTGLLSLKPSRVVYHVSGQPWWCSPSVWDDCLDRIFVGDSPNHGPNVVAFYDVKNGMLVPDSIGEYDSRAAALKALRSGEWYRSLPSWLLAKKAKKNRSYVGSGARGGFVGAERDRLPNWYFLKPSTRGWPAGDPRKGARDDMHAEEVIKYMNRGFGNRSDYPRLIAKLAERYPVEDVENREIWTLYRQYHDAIDEKMSDRGVRGEMPTVAELRHREVAVANRRRGRKRRRR